jgi:hypothetical protein
MSRSARLETMTRPLFVRPLATPGTGSRRARLAWVTAGLALGGIVVTGGAQALASNGHSSTAGPATAHASDRRTGVAATTPKPSSRAAATRPVRGDDDHSAGPALRDHRGQFCVHLDAKALAAVLAARRTADGGVDVPLSAMHLSRCKSPAPTGSPRPLPPPPPPHTPWPTVVPLPHPSHTWTPVPLPPVPVQPVPGQPQPGPRRESPVPVPTMIAPGPATTR